jgi:hypothetical protein
MWETTAEARADDGEARAGMTVEVRAGTTAEVRAGMTTKALRRCQLRRDDQDASLLWPGLRCTITGAVLAPG